MDIILTGAGGRIQASYHKSKIAKAPIAVIFHDTSQNSGHMNDPINYTLFYSFVQKGFSVVRFNFRRLDNAREVFENGEAELSDASSVVDWIQEQNEDASEFWLAGSGFGAWIAMQILMRRIEITGYVAVSPNLKKFDFSFFTSAPCGGLIVSAGEDTTINEENLKNFISAQNKQKTAKIDYVSIKDANNNFDGKLKDLFNAVLNYLNKKLP